MAGAPVFGPYRVALTADEFAQWAQRVAERQRMALARRYGWRASAAAIAVAAAMLAAFVSLDVVALRAAVIAFAAMAGAAALAHVAVRRQIVRAQQAAIAQLRGEREVWARERRVTLDAGGVAIETEGARLARPWSAFVDVERVGDLIALWSGVADGVALPLRALGPDAAAIEAEARARLAAR